MSTLKKRQSKLAPVVNDWLENRHKTEQMPERIAMIRNRLADLAEEYPVYWSVPRDKRGVVLSAEVEWFVHVLLSDIEYLLNHIDDEKSGA